MTADRMYLIEIHRFLGSANNTGVGTVLANPAFLSKNGFKFRLFVGTK